MDNPLVQPDPGLFIWTIITFLVLLYLAGRKMWELLTRRHPEPETHGDDGGRPTHGNQRPHGGQYIDPDWPFTDAEWEKCCAEARDARPWDEPAPENGSGERAGGGKTWVKYRRVE